MKESSHKYSKYFFLKSIIYQVHVRRKKDAEALIMFIQYKSSFLGCSLVAEIGWSAIQSVNGHSVPTARVVICKPTGQVGEKKLFGFL